MTLDVNLFDSPEFKKKVEVGDIIMAYPGSGATRQRVKEKPSNNDPSGVLGYVVGTAAHIIPQDEARFLLDSRFYSGDVLVYQFLPDIPLEAKNPIQPLYKWVNPDNSDATAKNNFSGPILVYGSIKENNGDPNYEFLEGKLVSGSMLLNTDSQHEIIEEIYKSRDLLPLSEFQIETPDGERYDFLDIKIKRKTLQY